MLAHVAAVGQYVRKSVPIPIPNTRATLIVGLNHIFVHLHAFDFLRVGSNAHPVRIDLSWKHVHGSGYIHRGIRFGGLVYPIRVVLAQMRTWSIVRGHCGG